MAASPRARQRGFTLIELLIALSIAAILLVIGIPAFGSILTRSHLESVEGTLHENLVHARETAIMRNVRVIVCPSPDGKRCVTTIDWQDGWLIASDSDHDNQPDRGKSPLAVFDALPARMRVLGSRGRPRIIFHPDGSATGSNAQLTVCRLGDPREGSAVIVSNSGRVREADAEPDRLEDCLARPP